MKKIFNILLITMCIFLNAYAAEIPEKISIHDNAGILSLATEKYIDIQNDILSEKCGAKIVFLTQDSSEEISANEFAKSIFDEWGIKSIGRANSVFVLMSPERKDYSVVISDAINASLTDEISEKYLIEFMEPSFEKGEYDNAAIKTFNAFASWYNENYNNVSLKLTEDLSEYEKMAVSEEKAAKQKTISLTLIVVLLVITAWLVYIHIRKQLRLKRLERRRIERRKRYMKSKRRTGV